jgi:hypothetical protein
VSQRADLLVRALLESDPDAPDASYLKRLPDQTEAAKRFVLEAVKQRCTIDCDDYEIHRRYALILREAIKQFGRPSGSDYADLFSTGMYEMSVRHASAAFMPADDAVEIYDDLLIGVNVNTEAAGEYPGGPATIIQVRPDPQVTEIVLQVSNPEFEDGEVGVFEYEHLEFL